MPKPRYPRRQTRRRPPSHNLPSSTVPPPPPDPPLAIIDSDLDDVSLSSSICDDYYTNLSHHPPSPIERTCPPSPPQLSTRRTSHMDRAYRAAVAAYDALSICDNAERHESLTTADVLVRQTIHHAADLMGVSSHSTPGRSTMRSVTLIRDPAHSLPERAAFLARLDDLLLHIFSTSPPSSLPDTSPHHSDDDVGDNKKEEEKGEGNNKSGSRARVIAQVETVDILGNEATTTTNLQDATTLPDNEAEDEKLNPTGPRKSGHAKRLEREDSRMNQQLTTRNRGYGLLCKLGWRDGQGLGVNADGPREPLRAQRRGMLRGGVGIGKERVDDKTGGVQTQHV